MYVFVLDFNLVLKSHLITIQHIITYLKGTTRMSLWYPKIGQFFMMSFSDADYAGCRVDRKRTSRTCQFLGNCFVSWSSKNQNSVALSTAEAEYVATGTCCVLAQRPITLVCGIFNG